MRTFNTFENLLVWQKAHAFALCVYSLTEKFQKNELFGLTSQLRRAAVSVPANIAEGFKKQGVNDKLRFYNIAQGSLEECYYYNILSRDLNYINEKEFENGKKNLCELRILLNAYCGAIIKNKESHKNYPSNF